jgi:hypothetical protein
MNRTVIAAVLLLLAMAGSAFAQGTSEERLRALEAQVAALQDAAPGLPEHDLHVAGYMSTLYHDSSEDVGSFSASFSPIFLYKSGERFLFESELALAFDGNETEVDLEYAQLDYMLADNFTLVTGKFLLPFGVFGERSHPSWINKLPSPPPIYGGHHGPGFAKALIPVLTDFGLQVRGGAHLGSMALNYAVYTVNGVRSMAMPDTAEVHGDFALMWTPFAEDSNQNKALGFRVGLIPSGGLELGLSYYQARATYEPSAGIGVPPDPMAEAPVKLMMFDATYQTGGLQLVTEYLTQDTTQLGTYAVMMDESGNSGNTLMEKTGAKYNGYYVQASYRLSGSALEPVVRYGKTTMAGTEQGHQLALGLDWWLGSSLVAKVSMSTDSVAGADAVQNYIAQFAFGF